MTEEAMTKLLETVSELRDLERALEAKRAELRRDLRRAHESGESVSELARRLDLSRARIQQLLREAEQE